MSQLDVYVLGAGASYVHGAPLTDGIIPYALTIPDLSGDKRIALVRKFLERAFHFRAPATSRAKGWSSAPGLVDVLSMVDMALDRRENLAWGYGQAALREVRNALEFCIFQALERSLSRRSGGRRSAATKKLVETLDPEHATFISMNYDVIVDIALALRGGEFDSRRADFEMLAESGAHLKVDYGVRFTNVGYEEEPEDASKFELLKLHGSFNWLKSALTGNLYYGGLRKAIGALFSDQRAELAADLFQFFERRGGATPAGDSERDLEPILVTPTHLKDLRDPHLARIWRRAEEVVRQARRITFIGYSLPGDDVHVKYLFKRALATRPTGVEPPRIVVVDKCDDPEDSEVRANYETFFGKKLVTYHADGFDAFVEEPGGLSG